MENPMNNPVIDKYGAKFWYDSDGKLHRDDGPAIEHASGAKEWFQHGNIHREDGPAGEWIDGYKEWFLNNRHLSFDEWLHKVEISDEKQVMMKLQHG
jgi:hypothetical protein